jgi:hypothetical protein
MEAVGYNDIVILDKDSRAFHDFDVSTPEIVYSTSTGYHPTSDTTWLALQNFASPSLPP